MFQQPCTTIYRGAKHLQIQYCTKIAIGLLVPLGRWGSAANATLFVSSVRAAISFLEEWFLEEGSYTHPN